MVSIRKRRGAGSGGNKCASYGKFILLGGIIVFLANMLTGGDFGDTTSLLHLQPGAEHDIPPSRREPPNFAHERLERRRKEEEVDINHERAKQLEKEEDHDDNPPQDHEEVEKESEKEPPPAKAKLNVPEPDSGDGRMSAESNDKPDEDADEDADDQSSNAKVQKIQYVSPNGEVLEKPEGTGPTKLGYVLDLVHERKQSAFRKDSVAKIESSRQNHAQAVATAISETKVQPCEYLEEKGSSTPRLMRRKECLDPERALAVYNGANFPRTWCGITIEPQSSARMPDDKTCTEPVHLFEKDFPPVDGEGMSPIVVHSNADGNVDESRLKDVGDCSIPCKWAEGMTGYGRYIQGTDWALFQSTKDPTSTREIQVELSKYKHDEYFSSAFFKSDVPLSPFDFSKHNLRDRPAIDFDTALDKAVYIVDEMCGSTNSRRTRWKEALEAVFPVDSPGKCNHNKDLEAGETVDTLEGRLEVAKKYKFHMGFEISTHKDWVTEASFEAFLSGAVPVILGATNANRHFPRGSAIYTSDFNNWDKFSAHVKEVAESKELWESYHEWRKDEKLVAEFEKKYQFTKRSPECRVCSWAYAKMYGLGWDHKLQIVEDTQVPRKICVEEDSGLIAAPFQEAWSTGSSSSLKPTSTGADGCSTKTSHGEKELSEGDWTVTRSVVQHDGVTDISIHSVKLGSSSDDLTLSFEFVGVNNTEAAFFRNSHSLVKTERATLVSSATIQDHKSKVTVLADWDTTIWSPAQGVLKVIVQAIGADEMRRIRLITENIDQLHGKMTEYFPSSYSQRMIKDFVDPLEVFYVD